MVRGAHEGIQNQVRIPNEGPKVLQVHPETLREHSWRRSGDQLGDLRNHEILCFLLRKCMVSTFCSFAFLDDLREAARDVPGGPSTRLGTPAPPPYNL